MKLVMTLLVRDEEDIIAANLDFHLAQGVDLMVVTDNNSEDETPGILDSYRRRGRVYLIREPEDTYSQAKWVTRMARLARVKFGADWVINGDADEFWWPERGTLRETLHRVPDTFGRVLARRSNFIPVEAGADCFLDRMLFRELESKNPLGDPMPPKLCHRGHPEVVVAQGNHDASADGLGPALDDGGITLFHFPMRSYAQFENKIKKGGRAYMANRELPEDIGLTWRRLYQVYLAGGLEAYYRQHVLDEDQMAAGIQGGRIVLDRRLRDFMGKIREKRIGG